MNINSNRSKVSCDPKTIWHLNADARHEAVTYLVQKCSEDFKAAVLRSDSGAAQDFAIAALGAVGGLFPEPDNAAHVLLTSLVGMLADAKSGRTSHLLMQNSKPIIGKTRGTGHAYIGGFAISAVNLLVQRNKLSALSARRTVAALLANAGCSLRSGDHGEPKPITGSAIRNWHANPNDFPLQHEIASELLTIHASNLTARNAVMLDEALAYFSTEAAAAVLHTRFF